MIKVLIIGGGPVGLFLAIKLVEKFGKKVEIRLYEKRTVYERDQIILFQPYLLNKTLPVGLLKMLENIVCHGTRAAYDDYGFCFGESLAEGQNLISIALKDLEKVLMKYLELMGEKGQVKIVHKEFKIGSGSGSGDMKWADIIVGAGGKKSYVRTEIMKAEFVEHTGFKSYGLAMTFEDKSNPAYFIKFDDKLGKAVRRIELKEPSIAQHRKRFFRSRGKWTYLGLQIDPEEFDGVEGKMDKYGNAEFVFKILPMGLKKAVRGYLDYHGSEPVNLDKVNVYVFKIKLEHSETYARIKDGKSMFVIGDAAIQSHFFTAFGINSGFGEVQNFVDILENYSSNVDGMDKAIDNYNYVMNQYREENIVGGVDATLPFRQIREICGTLDSDKLLEMAQKEGFKIDEFSKLEKGEMCNMLAKFLLENFKHIALLPLQ